MTRDYPKNPGPTKPPMPIATGGPRAGKKADTPPDWNQDDIRKQIEDMQKNKKK
jgi:hypothetical protein